MRITCPDEFTRSVVQEASRGWVERTGLRAAEVTVANGDPDPTADVRVMPSPQMPGLAAAGRLRPLPAPFTDPQGRPEWNGLLPVYREQLLRWGGEAYAVPLVGDAPLCFYRTDLFADERHVRGYRARTNQILRPPETWEEFVAIAEYFRDERNPGKPAPSLPPLPESSAGQDRLFYTVAASAVRRMALTGVQADEKFGDQDLFSFYFDIDTGRPRLDNPGFVHALRLLRRMQPCRPADAVAEPWRVFRDGRAVLCLGDARLLGEFQDDESPVRDLVGVCQVPGSRTRFNPETGAMETLEAGQVNRVRYLGAGAYLLAVPRATEQSAAAFSLLEELSGKRTAQQIVLEPKWGGGATRQEHLDESWDGWRLPARAEEKEGQSSRVREVLRQTLQPNLRNPVPCLRIPREHEFRRELTTRLRRALEESRPDTDAEAEAVLREVVARWNELIGPDASEHARLYRTSLGLSR